LWLGRTARPVDPPAPRSTSGQNGILEDSIMKKQTLKTAAYWITTVLGPSSFVIGAVLSLRQSPDVVAGVQHLGYPLYFATLLSFGSCWARSRSPRRACRA
jgi:hypothetical protein